MHPLHPPHPPRPSPFISLGPDIFERILSHICQTPLSTSYITTDSIRLLLPFALVNTSHYSLFRRLIARLSILPLGFSHLHPTQLPPPLPFPALLTPLPQPAPAAATAPTFPLAKVSPAALHRVLTLFPNLRALHLSLAAVVTDPVLSSVAHQLPALRHLRVPGNAHITVAGLSAIAVRCTLLHTLDLSYCKRLADECAPVLRAMPSLANLNVTYWNVSDRFVGAIAALPTLRSLAISACTRLSSDACREIGRQSTGLERFKFRAAPGLRDDGVRELARCTRLTLVDLSLARNLSDHGVAALGDAERLPELRTVLLSQCRMLTDGGVRLLARNAAIRCLDLSFCDLLTDECAVALRGMSRLEEVDLSGCRNFTDRGVQLVSESPSLVRIKLTHCNKLTDDSAAAIAKAPNVPLQSVDVWNCYGITPRGLEILKLSCTELRC